MIKRRHMYIQAQSTTVSKSLGDSTALGNHLPLTIREPFSTYHWRTILPLTIREPFSTYHWRTMFPLWGSSTATATYSFGQVAKSRVRPRATPQPQKTLNGLSNSDVILIPTELTKRVQLGVCIWSASGHLVCTGMCHLVCTSICTVAFKHTKIFKDLDCLFAVLSCGFL